MIDAFEALAGIEAFLADRLTAAVDPSLSGEVRAAAKVLAEVSQELRTLHERLRRECEELHELCGRAARLLHGPQAADQPAPPLPDDLQERLAARRALDQRAATLLIGLQTLAQSANPSAADARAQLDTFLLALQRQASQRMHWQSVFPVTPRIRHVTST